MENTAMRKVFTKKELDQMEKVSRLNLVNSCAGYKSANLIASRTTSGNVNLAMFGSVFHIGSEPPLLGLMQRPSTKPRDTYDNIKEFGWFTVNHVSAAMISDAHQTSAHYDADVSEFDHTLLEEEYVEGVDVPFVAESPIQLLCRFENEYRIQENGATLIVAAIEMIRVDFGLMGSDGWLRLDKGAVVAVNGLDGYALPRMLNRFSYAVPGQTSESLVMHNGNNTEGASRQIADSETAS